MRDNPRASEVVIYLLLVYALSTGFYVHLARARHMDISVFGLMWCPGVAGMLTMLSFRRALRGMGWKWLRA
jgi:hypothetical protein